MRPKYFVLLLAAAVVSSAVAIATYAAHNDWTPSRTAGSKLFPALAGDAQRIAALEVSQGGSTVTLQRKDDAWSIKERDGYPVEADKARSLLVGLAHAELVEAKTRKADRYALLELEDPAAAGAKSRLVRVLDGEGRVLAEAVVGKRRIDAFGSAKSGTYVRKPGNDQTWLTNADLEPATSVKDWIKATVFDTSTAKIKTLTVEIPGEEPLRIERAGEGADAKLAIAGLPQGRKLKDASAAESIARAAASIDLEDVRKLATPPAAKDASTVKLQADGVDVTMRIRKDGEAQWLSIAATGAEGEAKKTADEITARTQGWEFKIPSHKADALLKRRADLLEAS